MQGAAWDETRRAKQSMETIEFDGHVLFTDYNNSAEVAGQGSN